MLVRGDVCVSKCVYRMLDTYVVIVSIPLYVVAKAVCTS